MVVDQTVKRPALRYYGGKWRLASWIARHFPKHLCYVEPFGGAASVLLRKAPSSLECYNDADEEVVNFFRICRERGEDLIEELILTPYSRCELSLSYDDSDDPLERARRFFVRSWQAYGGPRKVDLTGWKYQSRRWLSGRSDQLKEWDQAREALLAVIDRLQRVQIECDDALRVIRRFDGPETLFYCDPPYPKSTRNHRWSTRGYTFELRGEDHTHLANLLRSIKGYAVVSSYPNDAYGELFVGWKRVDRAAQTLNQSKIGIEVLYLSPRTAEALTS